MSERLGLCPSTVEVSVSGRFLRVVPSSLLRATEVIPECLKGPKRG